jgi:putative transposase
MVTAATSGHRPFFDTPSRLTTVQNTLFETSAEFGWHLHAWSVFANHYHFVACSPDDPRGLTQLLAKLHANTARAVNREDVTPGRKVWFQFWDTHLSFERSYLARLCYTHHNPVKHGVVAVAENYPWCSAAWFHEHASPAFRRTVENFKTDRIKVPVSIASGCGDTGIAAESGPPRSGLNRVRSRPGAPGRAGPKRRQGAALQMGASFLECGDLSPFCPASPGSP